VGGRRDDLPQLHAFLDAATELDPRYQSVYWLGGTALVALDRRPDEAVRLLEKGRQALPGDWQIPYLMGYVYLFYYRDYAQAGEYIEEAARKVGRPTYLTALAARLHAQAGSPEAGLAFLEAMYRSARDPAVREGLATRMAEVVVDRDLRAIDAASARYRSARGRPPETVEELVRTGYLAAHPEEPFGGRYVVEPDSGLARSTTGRGRLKVYTPPGMGDQS
jgi:tetratricopeptide (TPR) repeat protein